MLPPVAGEYSLGGKTILIVPDIYIKTQLVYPYRPAMAVMSSLAEYCRAFIRVAMLSRKIFILPNPLGFDWKVLLWSNPLSKTETEALGHIPIRYEDDKHQTLACGTVSLLLNPSLYVTLGNNFFQRNSFHLDSEPALPSHLAHSTRPDSTKRIHFGKKIAVHSFQELPGTRAKRKEAPRYRLTTKILLTLFAHQASYKVWNHFILV